MITKLLATVFLILVVAGAAFGVGYFVFYQSSYTPPPSVEVPLPPASAKDLPPGSGPEIAAPASANGLLVVDALHRNSFSAREIATLRSRVIARGYDVEFLGNFTTTDESKRIPALEEKLRRADSFMVILPRVAYSDAESNLVERFVAKGGKLLLISDPTRPQQINTLAERFGINFQPDYLYNQIENDLNFQNIFVREFQPEELTAGVNAIALYTTGSIQSAGPGLAFTDGNTQSSLGSQGSGLSPLALGNTRNVLSLADLTFMIPPHDTILDNHRLLSNLADYLTDTDREFDLTDFPHFYRGDSDDDVEIVLGQPGLLDVGRTVKNGLAGFDISSGISSVEDLSRDTVFLGLHEDALQVSGYLQAAGVRIDDTLGGPFVTDLGLGGTAVTVLDANRSRHVLIILADTAENLEKAVARLLKGDYREDLVNDFASVSAFAEVSK